MRRRSTFLFLALSLAVAAPLTSSPRLAFADDTAKARATFQEGVQLEAAGNYAGALGKFQAVAAVKRTPQVVFHIAFCQEKLGHLVEALGGYRIAMHEAGDDAKMAKVAQTASDAKDALEKRIPTLSIKRGANADTAKISLDGVEIAGSTLDKPMQVDPGAHSVEATNRGSDPFSTTVKLAEGETKTVEITFKAKSAGAVAPVPADSAGDDTKPKDKKDDGTPPPKDEGGGSVVPWIIGGVGVASLIASGVFYLGANGAKSDLNNGCHGDVCPTSLSSTQDKGKSDALLGNIFLGVGVVGVGVGAVLLLTQGGSSSPAPAEPAPASALFKPKMDVLVSPTAGGMGANLVGTFLSSSLTPHGARPRSAAHPPLRVHGPRPHVRRRQVLWAIHARRRRRRHRRLE